MHGSGALILLRSGCIFKSRQVNKIQKLLIIFILILSLIPAFYLNRWLQARIQPRQSLPRLFFYILSCFALVFVYSFILVSVISMLFPVPKR
jgi:hypothetical protein